VSHTSAVVQELAAILERAEGLRTSGYDRDTAIAKALKKHRPGLALECVAVAAWALVVGSDDNGTSPTAPDGGARWRRRPRGQR
jgi:hypothetical protein